MDPLHAPSRICEATIHELAISRQSWCKSSNVARQGSAKPPGPKTALIIFETGPSIPELERLPMRQASHSNPAWKSLQFDAHSLGVMDAHRNDVSMGIAPNYSGVYPFERSSTYNFPRWKVEGPSTSMPIRNNPFPPSAHSNKLTTTISPVLSTTTSINPPMSAVVLGAKQLPFHWPASKAMVNSVPVDVDQTGFEYLTVGFDLDNLMGCDQPQWTHGCPVKREVDQLSSTLFDLQTEAPTRVAKSGTRHICGICSKSHARPSRAIACENSHLGYQPFVCDGTCGDPVW
ncbi:hypothetical protein FRB91_003625 [Serendipita sp. 411]|nr:hypothetical protein FRB91_003625 [Serendipita sp. 411]